MGSVRRRARREARERRAQQQQADAEQNTRSSADARQSQFERYYRAQQILPDKEWPQLLRYLHRPLPACLRFSQSSCLAQLLERLQSFCSSVALQSLQWAGNAVQLALDKGKLRKHVELQAWVKRHTECGDITRQEAVSMVPALLLEARGDEWLLDMCAAPGSKTGQLLEIVAQHEVHQHGDGQGLVVANELDSRRAQMLVHQCRRLCTASLMVTCHAAQHLPRQLDGCFHRVLADVPCSGDGTLRKNKRIWNTWTHKNAMSLHPTQLQILLRALQLCRAGGRVVYSTCSLNPIENEAVVAEVLRQKHGEVTLVDVRSLLPELRRRPGIERWGVPRGGKMLWERPKAESSSMFSPSESEAKWMSLDRCVRIYPHLQDTGGFFVAVLQRTDMTPVNHSLPNVPPPSVLSRAPPKNALVWYSPFDQHPGWPALRQRYTLPSHLGASQLLLRNGCASVVYYVNKSLASLLLHDQHRTLKHGNSGLGVPAFQANQKGDYHITQTGLQALMPFLSKPVLINCGKENLIRILEGLRQDMHVDRAVLTTKLRRSLDKAGHGGAALVLKQFGVLAVAVVIKQRNLRLLLSEVEVLGLREQLAVPKSSGPEVACSKKSKTVVGGQLLDKEDANSVPSRRKSKRRREEVESTTEAQQQHEVVEPSAGGLKDHCDRPVPKRRKRNRGIEK